MVDTRKKLGDFGEQMARVYLQKNGYRIIESNFRCDIGEIDIVARDGDFVVFVEVRTRKGGGFGSPEESVTRTKQKKLVALAEFYLQQHEMASPWRIDVMAIELNRNGEISRMEVIPNAIG